MGYPIVSGDPASHNQGVERKFPKRLIIYAALTDTLESGNMLIMALAHARTSGDGSLISEHVGGPVRCCPYTNLLYEV